MYNGNILSLGRAGYLADTSKFEQHQVFSRWVTVNEKRFRAMLKEGERVVGEWMAQAHGTRYNLSHEPFVIFDIMQNHERKSWDEVELRCKNYDFVTPHVISRPDPISIDSVLNIIKHSSHGAIDEVEGAVWRVERNGQFDFMAKFVRPDKQDGKYLPEISQREVVWNWRA